MIISKERRFGFTRKIKDGVKVNEKAYESAKLPMYATRKSAGADFYCAKDVVIPAGGTALVHTGVSAQMLDDEVLLLFNRSGNVKRNLMLANGVGVIDADYFGNESNDGEIIFAFYNTGEKDVYIYAGERIGQGVFTKFLLPENAEFAMEDARIGGFGSTGRG